MPVAQGSSGVLIYSCAPVAKGDTRVCLCSCTLCEGLRAQVTISPHPNAPPKPCAQPFPDATFPYPTLHYPHLIRPSCPQLPQPALPCHNLTEFTKPFASSLKQRFSSLKDRSSLLKKAVQFTTIFRAIKEHA